MMEEAETAAEIQAVALLLAEQVPHTFEIITALGDGTSIPVEALSDDHTIGLYGAVIPRKMRDSLEGFREVEVADFILQRELAPTPTGARMDLYLEFPGLRDIRFRAERLQYLEEGWWAATREVKYPAETVLGCLHVMKQRYGEVRLYLNGELPMPLWVRSDPLGEPARGVQIVIQARGEGRVLFTNIHSECTMEYARQFAEAARSYYRTPGP
ncbi:MAG: hypothetical protein MUQ65_14120 [Armatimonadetes bacterium]|nr:hypothetical protein [Armatimonadota bacterium]